ncbi:MAG: IclR family transcriptional regulator, partial [Pigmentiphaga sp.]
ATVTEISTQLGYPQSSTSMLLSTLTDLGYLMLHRPSKTYRPSLRVMLLGAWMHDELFGEGRLVSQLDKLRRTTHCTVMLGVRQDVYTRVMLVLWGKKRWAPRYAAGSLIPITRSSSGKILLLNTSNADILHTIARNNNDTGNDASPVNAEALLHEINQIRHQGWACTLDYPKRGLGSIAVALPPIPDHPPISLALGTTKAELVNNMASYISTLQNSILRISDASPPNQPFNPTLSETA